MLKLNSKLRSQLRSKLRVLLQDKPMAISAFVTLVVIIALAFHLVDQHRYIRSDDALIESHFTTLSARVPGTVVAVYVNENEKVKKNQILVKLDDRNFRTQLNTAKANQASMQVQYFNAEKDFSRASLLFRQREITRQSFEQQQTHFLSLQHKLEQATAETERAEINLAYTQIAAPADGITAERAANVGMELQVGDPVFGIVFPQEKWIEAKIKETDLKNLSTGEKVQVKVDAIPHREFEGTLLNLSATTEGLESSLVPDNSSGNFTKFVQRVPLRIALSLSAADQELVRTGLSAEIRLRREN